jgi:hypothetical protein
MIKLVYIILLSLFIFGCSGKPSPVQTNNELKFGQYIISPPKNYWYFPRKYPTNFRTSKDIFLLTFWKDKEDISRKDPNHISIFFNLAVSANKYKNFEDYYNRAKAFGVKYNKLPDEAGTLKTIQNWSCKQTGEGIFGIECISLGDNLVTIGAYGNDKGLVFSNIPLLQKMLESFKLKK